MSLLVKTSNVAVLLLVYALGVQLCAQTRGTQGSASSVTVNFKQLPQTQTLTNTANAPSVAAESAPPPMPPPPPPAITGRIATNNELPPKSSLQVSVSAPAPATINFQALVDNITTIPPDTMGAVGPNHVMTILNSQVLIQNRTGGVISTASHSAFWAPSGASGPFDPHLIYEPFNSRWIASAVSNAASASSSILVAMSQTNDPTGTWTMIKVPVGSATNWADYPTISFNKDWVVVTVNLFSITGGNFVQSNIYVFRKADLLANAATIRYTLITNPNFGFAPAVTYDNVLPTMYLVQRWNGNSGGYGSIALNTITGALGAEILNASGLNYPLFVTTPNPWNYSGSSGDFAPQLGQTQKIDSGDDRLTAAVYRNGSLWFAHTIFVPAAAPTRSAVQWWQINPTTGVIIQRSRIEDATSNTFYAYPSIAVNANNDALIGYSRFGAAQYASADFAFRYGTDSLNTLQSDVVFKSGESPYYKRYGGSRNRWGDYSSTVVDPVDDIKLWTIQEYPTTPIVISGTSYDRWATWWSEILVASPAPGIQKSFGAASIAVGGTTSLSFTITNPNQFALTGVALTDTLPAGLAVANPNGLTGSCGGVVSAVAASSIIALTAGSVPAGGSCNYSVNVTGTVVGVQNNVTGAITSANAGTGGTASASITVSGQSGSAPTTDSVSPASGSGSSQTFTFKYSSGNGYSYLNLIQGLINTSIDGSGACYFQYYPATSRLYLFNDTGSGYAAQSLTPGLSATASNSQCAINGSGFTATGSGNQLTLAIPVNYTNSFAGLKSIYGYAADQGNLNSGWKTLGTWTTNGAVITTPPTADSVSPASGSGASQTFTFKYSSVNGYGNLSLVQGLINTSVNAAAACNFQYYPATTTLYLVNDAGSGNVAQSLTPGQSASASNSQCTISGAGFTATGSGSQLTLAIPVTFTGAFAGLKSIYGYASDQANLNSGWKTLGTWTTNSAVNTTPPTADSVTPASGSGSSQTFTFKYSSVNGYGNLSLVQGLVNTSVNAAAACNFQYYPATTTLYLVNDAGSGNVAQSLTPGQSASASNSQCTISGAGFTAAGNGSQLTLAIPVTFTGAFAGLKSIYGYAADQANLNSGWKTLGTWTNNIAGNTAPTADSVSPTSGSGTSQTFTFKYSSGIGYSYLHLIQGLINTAIDGSGACYFQYYPASSRLYLFNDTGNGYAAQSLTPGLSATATNSQCAINGSGFTATGSGNQLTLVIPVTFTNSFAGLKTVYGYAADQGNLNSGWKTLGTWTTSGAVTATPPTADSVTPASGSGSSQTFTFKYSSANGYGNLILVQGLVNTSVNAAAACNFQYFPATTTLYLINDAGSGNVAQSLTPGQSASASNSQCTISGAGFTATGSGTQLTLAIPVTFTGAFAGLKSTYGYAADLANLNSGWKTLGTWTTNGAVNTTPPTADSVNPASGSGSSQTFTFKYSSTNGYANLSLVQGLVNTSVNAAAACNFQYYPASATLYLINDAGSGNVAQSLTPGQSASASNSQCTISGVGFTAAGSGTQLTLAIPVTFTGAFAGLKSIYGYAADQANLNSGWKTLGTWTTNAAANGAPTADSVGPASGGGSSQTFTFKYSSGNGYGYLNLIQGLINTAIDGSGACYFQYYPASSRLYLFNDTGSGYAAQSLTPGLSATASNSQCAINGSGFTATGSGNQWTLAVPVTFTGSFAGLKSIYGYAADQGNLNSGWKTLGTWTTSGAVTTTPPTADSVTPASGSGSSQTFTYKYSSANGYGNLNLVQGLINTSVNGTAGACYFQYFPASTMLYLINDAGTGNVAQSLTPGQSASASNSQCTISGASFTATGSGTQLTLAIPVTFAGAFAGLKSIYGYAADQANLNSGWKALGTWTTITAGSTAPTADSVSPSSGSGSSQTFTFKYSSGNGYGYLNLIQGLINAAIDGSGACYFQYYPATTRLYLFSDTGSGYAAQSLTPGLSATASNSQCAINGSGFTVTGSGNQLTLVIPVTFTGSFTGLKSIYGYAADQGNQNSGWKTLGTSSTNGVVTATPRTANSVSRDQ